MSLGALKARLGSLSPDKVAELPEAVQKILLEVPKLIDLAQTVNRLVKIRGTDSWEFQELAEILEDIGG